ncbi:MULTISPECIES: HTH-type transcriptional regulator GlpR [Haloarcula]|jgi:DeoR/GlpR family transcriptional regulator of sugar metabolism|uniref:DeoR/GlpR transcriptional regulator n=2 Tax=Haloarcula marismortui TaxID=2238 RepID=Q5UXV7_HALMA|nr:MULTISPECIES: HTH-type transcriptional regulator GlpR [Haloarcula]AAV47896.1 transcriptional regulator of sugar metabolism [Haloarcula marismortui ATCC 43049]EMA12096.1 transcriptional regulator of sugar metabolism [Haloarcula sinaiiensis ATCC 33800]NHN63906.1 DeoR/GlpR transcriptional regulator [Haloarcula sp. JP-Z28]NHX39384.1 DeoR/GlpR transcriptional regulator [Haloarcula sp. R1-2]QCP92572.1 DeoR/GlpR transcriptional regulator [Haloarcula marismortui ATCC 43049]
MIPDERRKEIVRQVNRSDRVTVEELTEEFGVSEATIRRDLSSLAEDGLIERFHGGALPASEKDGSSTADSIDNPSGKRAIAKRAVDELSDGDAVFFDTGPTAREIAKAIPEQLSLLAATNSPESAFELRETCGEVKVVGDSLRQTSDALVGPSAESYLRKTNFDIVFLETDAVQIDGGLSVSNEDEARIKTLLCEGGRHVILVADGSKLDSQSFREFATVEDIDMFITDVSLSDEMRAVFEQANVAVIDNLLAVP